jgi:hypothetical protein
MVFNVLSNETQKSVSEIVLTLVLETADAVLPTLAVGVLLEPLFEEPPTLIVPTVSTCPELVSVLDLPERLTLR